MNLRNLQNGAAKLPVFALVLGLVVTSLRAQDVVAPRQTEDVVPAALQQQQAAENLIPSAAVPTFAPDSQLIASGPFTFRAHLSYRFLDGDGVPAINGQRLKTQINAITPDLFLDFGTHWTLNYSPTWTEYSNAAFKDSFDQSVRVSGWGTYEDWTLQLDQSYSSVDTPLIETGAQTKQTYSGTNVRATYSFNSAMALEMNASHSYQSAEQLTSSNDWSTLEWLHYKAAPQLDTALGLGIGFTDVSQGSNMTYYRPQAQVIWSVTNKINLTVHGGFERRHFESGGTPDKTNPIYGLTLDFRPIETTRITAGVDRQVTATLLNDEISNGTTVTLQVEQRLFREFYLTVGGSHQKLDYIPLVGSPYPPRSDDSNSFNARLSTTLFRRCSVSVLFQDSHNSSTLPGFGLSSRQYGVELGYRF